MNDALINPYNNTPDAILRGHTGAFSPWNPFSGAPGGAMFGMALPFLPNSGQNTMFGNQLFGFDFRGSPMSAMQDMMFSQSHFAATKSAAAKRDVDVLMQMTGMGMGMAGREFAPGGENYNATRKFFEAAAPFGAYMNPASMDVFYGGRSGSVLTSMVHLGGRQMIDPVTGFRGLSGASAGAIGDELWSQFYGSANWRQKTGGLTSYQMGGLFSELTARGMIPGRGANARSAVLAGMNIVGEGPGGDSEIARILEAAKIDPESMPTGASGKRMLSSLTDSQAEQIRNLRDPTMAKGMRVAEARRISSTLKEYTGAVTAVAEIFGEAGRPDAPMAELISALDKLTGGGMARMGGARLQTSVRQIHASMKDAKMDLSALNTIGLAAGQAVRMAGLDETFVGQILPSTMGAVSAYNNLGFGATAAWGKFNQLEMTRFDVANRAAAAASPMANRLGAIMRMSDRNGGLGGAAGRMVEAIRSGNISADQMGMDEGAMIDLLSRGSGISADRWQKAFRANRANSEFVNMYGITDLVAGRGQARDFYNLALGTESGAFAREAGSLVAGYIGANEGLSGLISRAAGESLRNIRDPNDRSNAQVRNSIAARGVFNALRKAAAGGDQAAQQFLASGGGKLSRLRGFIEDAWSQAGQEYFDATGNDIINDYNRLSPQMLDEQRRIRARTEEQARAMAGVTGMLSGSPILKMMESFQKSAEAGKTDLKTVFTDALASALGGKDSKEVAATMGGMLADMQKRLNTYEKGTKSDEELAEMSAEERKNYEAQRKAKVQGIGELQAKIKSFMNEHGLTQVLGELVTKQQAEQASTDGDTAGVSGSGGATVVLQIQTLNLNGEAVANNVRSGNTPASQGGRKVGAA